MLSPKDLTINHPLVERALAYIAEHNGYILRSGDISRAVGLHVKHDQTRCAIGAQILKLLLKHNMIYMREASHGQRRYWVVQF